MVDGPAGIGVAMMAQSWTATLDGFGTDLRLAGAPITGVTEIRFLDRDLTWQVVPVETYRVILGQEPARIVLAPAASWPRPVAGVGTVQVDYTLGADTREGVHPALLGALRLLVGHFYEHREAVAAGITLAEVPLGVRHILDGHRRGVVAS